jgi:hypothetical protein
MILHLDACIADDTYTLVSTMIEQAKQKVVVMRKAQGVAQQEGEEGPQDGATATQPQQHATHQQQHEGHQQQHEA